MRPYYERAGITVYLGDSRSIAHSLHIGGPLLVLTDPPYGIAHPTDYKTRKATR